MRPLQLPVPAFGRVHLFALAISLSDNMWFQTRILRIDAPVFWLLSLLWKKTMSSGSSRYFFLNSGLPSAHL